MVAEYGSWSDQILSPVLYLATSSLVIKKKEFPAFFFSCDLVSYEVVGAPSDWT